MAYQVTVKIRSEDGEHPPYVYERTTRVRLSEFSQARVKELIEEACSDFEATYPHGQGRERAMLVPPTKVTVLEVD